MRKGLRPLPAHIGMATAAYCGEALPFEALSQAQGVPPDMPPSMQEDIKKMLLGVQQYQFHECKAPRSQLEPIWQQGEVSLNRIPEYEYEAAHPAILLVPSLVNKSDILDLMPGRSMLRWLGAQNINPYLLDWGRSVDDAGQQDMESVVLKRLVPALEFLHHHHGGAIHALGYCMGGTVLVGAAARASHVLRSVIFLAAPWDFHAGGRALLNRVQFWAPSAFPLIEEKGFLPVDWIQMLFASLDPAMMVRKFANFADMEPDSERAQLFVAVEDWLNDGVDLPAEIAQHCIRRWFVENEAVRGEWQVGGRGVHPEDIECPALVIASDKDRLVEYETAAALQQQLRDAHILNPHCGHIGMIAGQHSVEKVWRPVAEWVREHS